VVGRDFIIRTRDGILLNLRVSPNARRTSIEGPYGESAIRLKVAAPPVGGKANAEVETFLAKLLGIPRSNVIVVKGTSSRDKVVLLNTSEQAEIREILTAHLR
jgi:uncharacterized protein (TIGR00251 family)